MAAPKLFLADIMVLVLASGSLIITVAQDVSPTFEVWRGCSPQNYRYVNDSAFHDNLETGFSSLASNISSSNASFFATSVSSKGDTDEVYAMLLCRKYLTSKQCLECLTAAEKGLKEECSNNGYNGGRNHLDGCLLRYENSSFFEMGTDGGLKTYCPSSNSTKPQEFEQAEERLLAQLTANASRSEGYAVGMASIASTTVYGLVQCAPTLSNASCQDCLTSAQNSLVKNCLPKQQASGLQGTCFIRYATNPFYANSTSRENPLTTPSNRNSKTLPILLGSIGGAALLAVLCSLFICRRFSERFKGICFSGMHRYTETEGDLAAEETFEQVLFEWDVIRDATANFDNTNILGKGGFAVVYKGRLADGRTIAVKKLNERGSSKAKEDFLREVKLISSVRHRYLVRLLGCSARGHERLLVYEFMANNSLDKHLFRRLISSNEFSAHFANSFWVVQLTLWPNTGDTRNHLDWETRFNVIVGTARGLAYLHEDSNERIVHRDIKAANILLDDKFQPKIADFGLAKFFPEGESQVSTKFGGTIGYIAPEYAVHGQLSEKADVYSYGVLVLEIVSGRKCVNQKLPATLQLLLEWAWRQYQSEEAEEIVEVRLREREYPREQVVRVITIALLCCQASPALRPTMTGVVSMLTTASQIDVRPTQPAYIHTSSSNPPASASDPAQSHGSITVSLIPR